MKKLSLIIPVHNSEKYLPKFLDSLLAEDYFPAHFSETEFIFVMDHSTDSSLSILEKYKKSFKNCFIYNSEGYGASSARNFGLSKATGEYVWFLDSDDYIAPHAISTLISTADSSHADFVHFTTDQVYEDGHSIKKSSISEDENWQKTFIRYGLGPWGLLIRRDFLLDNHLLFPEGIIHEDMALMSAFPLFSDRFASVPDTLYFYRQHSDSVLHNSSFNPNIFDIFPALDHLYEIFKSQHALEKYHSELEYFFIWNLLDDAALEFSRFREAHSGFRRSRRVLKKYFRGWRRNPYLLKCSKKIQLRIHLAYFGFTKSHPFFA